MKYICQLLYILLFSFAGEALQVLIPLPIPAAIYGMVLLLIALSTGLLKSEYIADTARFLIAIMPVLFVVPVVNILRHWGVIASRLGAIIVIVAASTFVVFAVSGLVTKWYLRKKGGDHNG
ncbi:MAG: CidA/LrgA family protein [Oscillospiraceae bacterium]|nr:CidA/LrgA family protein [Oscillospiraceae bacterium]